MAVTPTGRLLPFLLAALALAAGIGILASYVMPHRHHDITGGGNGMPGTAVEDSKPAG